MEKIPDNQIPRLVETADGGAELVVGPYKLNVDANGNFNVDADGNTVEKVVDGVVITRKSGFKFKMLDAGGVEFVTKPKSVGIHDLALVTHHQVNVNGDTSRHSVVFKNGDSAQITFKNGVFEELVSGKLGYHLNSSDELFISQGGEPKA